MTQHSRDSHPTRLPPGVSVEAIQAEIEKILASNTFAKSKRLSRFLRFTIERTIQGEVDKIKEFLIGTEVFDRNESFDPRIDSIVRVEACRLRARLKQYYEKEGLRDPILIKFRKGSYAPAFIQRKRRDLQLVRLEHTGLPEAQWKTIAVLPFTDLSPSKEQEYFCDGMAEELIHVLTKVPGLRVVAPTTVFPFKGAAQDVRRIGRELQADTVLEGSVRKVEERIRIAVKLVHVHTGYVLWSEAYDRLLKDVFAIQEEISAAIAGALRLELGGEPAAVVRKRSSENLEAYHFYLKGRFYARRLNEESLGNAVREFKQAIVLDQNYAKAYAAMANAFGLTAFYAGMHPRRSMKSAKASALKALEIDEGLSEAHAVLGLTSFVYDRDWSEAERRFRRATDMNPSDSIAHNFYALFLGCMGRLDEAIATVRRAFELDPVSLLVNINMGWLLYLKRKYDRALEQFHKTQELYANSHLVHFGLGLAYEAKSMSDEAVRALEQSRSLSPGFLHVLGALGHCLALKGEKEKAQALLEEMSNPGRFGAGSQGALVYLGLGLEDVALDCLEKACTQRDPWVVYLKVDPRFSNLRSNSSFVAILRDLGLES